ncbi:hypothetical protein ACO0SA_002508 [Hanseniaspora valbyensis]
MSLLNYFEILDVNEYSSLDVIKKNYKKKLLENHPDKNNELKDTLITIDQLKQAYYILSNYKSKLKYIEELKLGENKTNKSISNENEISLENFTQEYDKDNDIYEWHLNCPRCHCEKGYSINENLLEDNFNEQDNIQEVVINCSMCSQWLKVQYTLA